MKCLKKLLSLLSPIVAVLLLVAMLFVPAFAADSGNHFNSVTPRPVYANSGTVTALAADADAAGSIAANSSRLAGEIRNTSGAGMLISLSATTTTTIYANPIRLYPTGDSAGRDIYKLKQDGVIYTGTIYYMGVDSTTYTENAAATGTLIQWK